MDIYIYFLICYAATIMYHFRYMAAMEAKKVKEKDIKPAGTAAGGGRGRGAATKEVSRPQPGGGGHKCKMIDSFLVGAL